jgi:hypothetical protein
MLTRLAPARPCKPIVTRIVSFHLLYHLPLHIACSEPGIASVAVKVHVGNFVFFVRDQLSFWAGSGRLA